MNNDINKKICFKYENNFKYQEVFKLKIQKSFKYFKQ